MMLALETSCDDTCAAVMTSEGHLLSSVIHSQDVIHKKYGGVVPEVASRAHAERATVVVREALEEADAGIADLGAVAVTVGPGLIGALLIGVNTGKAIAWARRLPLIPVNHLHGHLGSMWLTDPDAPFPFLALVVSGGHTMLVRVDSHRDFTLLGQTLDDAAGEAMDKAARLLGLGYPGGKELDQLAEHGDPTAYSFPIALRAADNLNLSFSGVKTAMYYLLRDMSPEERIEHAADVAASYRAAVVEALVSKLLRAAVSERVAGIAIGGGVAANSLLRQRVQTEGRAKGFHVVVPSFELCTDNAAMIASAALYEDALPYPTYLDLEATASLTLGQRVSAGA
ncbi:MAG: tRNA (adenosine(37)-N6)-threonylcarbamoyltransferase complex transferase subunit TsaD [Actinobacteria bacterium]|nr:tRNA (adenosine(37)-N6)-threonylcarbamoyltransferase complex transferase subunit TsaD [Actinomycetota bacterium]